MQKKSIYFFIGTSAELIKIAPIIKEFQRRGIKFKIITSGQNKVNFEDLINFIGPTKADISFKEKINKSSILYFIFWAFRTLLVSLVKLRKEFKKLDKNNSYFIIQGDTVSSLIGAIIAKIFNLKLVHIESGDLSFNILEPFPEEICRNININLADILFPPNAWAEGNLKNVKGVKINTKYNTLIESFRWAIKTKLVTKDIMRYKKYYILIMHRQEHVLFRRSWSKKNLEFIINNADPTIDCLLLNHPLTVSIINSLKLSQSQKIKIISRVPYPDFMKLMTKAKFIVSDGCTNQLEAYLMGTPFLALRNLTEQIEGLNENVVISKGDKSVIKGFLSHYNKYKKRLHIPNISPSKIIVDYLMAH